MASWISIAKPGEQSWLSVNPQGREQYDDSGILYDSTSTFYDSVNPSQWTVTNTPVTPSWVSIPKPS